MVQHQETNASLLRRIENSGFGRFIGTIYPGVKVQKITINAGTSCPNRDGSRGRGGCSFCLNSAFSPAFAQAQRSITEQLEKGKEFFSRKYKDMKYLAYFQTYTSTYQDVSNVMAQYREALSCPDVVGLVVSTRPDCMPNELLSFLREVAQKYLVIVEYGVESTLDSSLVRINRGHTFAEAKEAIQRTADFGLRVGVHLILGLPGEMEHDVIEHARVISRLPISLVKLHQLQVLRGTAMAHLYEKQPHLFVPLTPDSYAQMCLSFVSHLREDIHLDRFVSQSPKHLVLAPDWNIKNFEFHHLLIKKAQSFL